MNICVSTISGRAVRLGAAVAVLALAGSAQTLTTLYNFTGASGANPTAPVVFGANGSLFGTTPYGGNYPGAGSACQNDNGCGTVYELTPGTPWTETPVYSFQGGTDANDGANPTAGLIAGTGGVFYGTTFQGGSLGNGTVFELKAPAVAGQPWTETVLYSFQGAASGTVNVSGATVTLVSGTPFVTGTTWNSGVIAINGVNLAIASVQSSSTLTLTAPPTSVQCPPPCSGVSYLMSSAPAGPWAGWPDGGNPMGSLVLLTNGNLYGTTFGGGTGGAGAVFELTPPKGGTGPWTETVIYNIGGGKLGSGPESGLVLTKGSLFGTTCCGTVGGVVFKLTPGTKGWNPSFPYSFGTYATGHGPVGGMAIDANGVLYGTTKEGGPGGAGIVYSLTPPATGSMYTLNTIHAFAGTVAGTVNVSDATVTWVSGNQFVTGTTGWVGLPIDIHGTIYTIASVTSATSLTLTASAGTQTGVGYRVDATPDGGAPYGAVVLGPGGVLYVTVTVGCANGAGGVLQFTPPVGGTGPWTEAILYSFTGAADGSEPFAGVTLNNSTLYGTTAFSLLPGATGTVSVSGTTVTWVSGNEFITGTAWDDGAIEINGTRYFVASVTSATSLTLTSSAGTQTGVSYSVGEAPGYGSVFELVP